MIKHTQYYISGHTDPRRNLAVEEELLLKVEPETCILYLWQNAHTVVIGKNQNARKECKADLLESEGGTLVRRLSGGGAVYHDLGNLNFTFLVREQDYDVDRQLSVIIRALEYFGVHAEQTGRNDVVIDGRKFSGNAFYKTDGKCYHHGTLLIDVDMDRLSRYLNVSLKKMQSKGVKSVKSRVINLSEVDTRITVESMKEALIRAFGEVYGTKPEELLPDSLSMEAVDEKTARYASDLWRFGNDRFSYSCEMEERYSWGEIQLLFRVEQERILDCTVYSDAMDETFIPMIADALNGLRFCSADMVEAVRVLTADSPLREQMKQDLQMLIETNM